MQISKRAESIITEGIRGFSGSDIVYDLTVGQPDFPVPNEMKNAIKQIVDENKNGYIKTGGEIFIRQKLAQDLKSKHTTLANLQAEEIVITPGVTGGIFATLLTLINENDKVLLPDPYFSPYIDMVKLVGGIPKLINTYPDFALTADKLEEAIDSQCKLLILNHPNNPTGRTLSKQELEAIVELCHKHNITIMSDEIYENFVYKEPYTSIADITKNAILLKGFSKSHGATGWRIGYVVAPGSIANIIERVMGKVYVSAPSITHYAIPEALDYNNTKIINLLKERRNLVLSILSDVCPDLSLDGGFFVFLNVFSACGCDADTFVQKLRKHGVAILPGRIFSQHNTHCRISLTIETSKLINALKIIRQCIIENKK